MTKETDWISAVCSVVAAVVAVVTLLTVYLAAMQILSRRQIYRLGVSTKSLGPWKSKVVRPSLLRMQTQISTPTISLPKLVKKNWEPSVTFPTGFECRPKKAVPDPEDCVPVLAEASWVNFLESLGLEPEKSVAFYEMQSEAELVNGIVPMRWKGRDLVGICSILGFQVFQDDDKLSFTKPMPLPIQWSGPLGWMQFRASSDGCIVEYRRRALLKNQLSSDIHEYYQSLDVADRPLCLVSRLWQSINGLYLPNNEILYIGGTDRLGEERRNRAENIQRSTDEICDEAMKFDLTEEEMRKMLFGKKSRRPDALGPEAAKSGLSQLSQPQSLSGVPEFLRCLGGEDILKTAKKSKRMEVLNPCPGLLSIIVEGELADSRGLDFSGCHEYDRLYTDLEDVNRTTYPYKLGCFFMKKDLLELIKKAVLLLEPDGFYFSPTCHLYHDVSQIWSHVEEESNKLEHVFPKTELTDWRTVFTINDMRIISKASVSLRRIVSSSPHAQGMDLVWAMIASPELFSDLVQRFGKIKAQSMQNMLDATVLSRDGWVDCKSLTDADLDPDLNLVGRYEVPLISEGDFSGTQILAAFLDVFLTFFWMERKWISNVSMYDTTIPQSVTMC
ncbi:hypothetical protein K440DRAFT_536560 [Wilcoxina mikolae CBS 423.85]|nr:hypothetical protein K440DRAFT_536560 [Wilcoxina mikolae CBS 423.85]